MKMFKYSVKMSSSYFAVGTKDLSRNNLSNTFSFLNKIGLAIYENVQVQCKNVIKLFRGGY